MPPTYGKEGLDAAQRIRTESPDTALVVLSADLEVEHALTLLAGGGRCAYLRKSRAVAPDFVDTIERVVGGASVVDAAIVRELVDARRLDDPLDALAPHERELVALMAEGRTNGAIARALELPPHTVDELAAAVPAKLGLPALPEGSGRVRTLLRWLDTR
jgi:DNA-binding NarL/FixJ family response regulator